MKFTKRAYVKVWQNRPIDDREDTTITLYDHEDTNEPNSIHLLERHAFVNSMEEFDILRTLKLNTETQPTFDLAESNQ